MLIITALNSPPFLKALLKAANWSSEVSIIEPIEPNKIAVAPENISLLS